MSNGAVLMAERATITPRPEIAELLHERRFTRFLVLTRDVPWIRGGGCAWCGNAHRRGNKYCSRACSDEANVRASGVIVQSRVFDRDKGVCAECGIDCLWLRSERNRIWNTHKRQPVYARLCAQSRDTSWGPWSTHNYKLWEADHIVPVVEGGGVCGLDNYRTMCIRCHKAESARLAKRRAKLTRRCGTETAQGELGI